MFVITAQFQAKAGKEEELEQTLKGIFPFVQKEAGSNAYILHRVTNTPGKLFFYEQYKDKEAFDYHSSTPHFKELFGKVEGLIAGPPVVEFLEEVASIKR
jgi:quinol monooxygenase YgiN